LFTTQPPLRPPPLPYTTLFRSIGSALVLLALTLGGRRVFERARAAGRGPVLQRALGAVMILTAVAIITMLDVSFDQFVARNIPRSEEHTSELQSRGHLVCRLLL